ncbi:MAG: aminopeptidase P family protein, partial [Kiritimatiellae bacterium]|nr:aminopeptidase P family protein [Kiritimatiellia bacterium]
MFTTRSPEWLEDLAERRRRVQSALAAQSADGLLIAHPVNLLYLTGRVYCGWLYLPAVGEARSFVRRPNTLEGPGIFQVRKPEQIPEILQAEGVPLPKRVLLEAQDLTHWDWLRLAALFPEAETEDGSSLLRGCRAVKSPGELAVMRLTGSRQAALIDQFASVYEPGMTDQAWMTEIFGLMMRAGSLGHLRVSGSTMEPFIGCILVGENGAEPSPYDYALGGSGLSPALPVGQSGVRLEAGMSALVDVPGNFFGYLTDCSRTFSIGTLPPRALEAHQLSIEIEQAIAEAGRPGTPCVALYEMALEMAARAGFADCFMGTRQQAQFVGHGTGLVINEWPVLGARSRHRLEAGMCVALEPKFVIEGVGPVGVEDTFVVTPEGMRNITPCDPA